MIKKLTQSSLDKKYLSLRPYIATPISVNFSNFIVNKPWGNEYLMHKNPTMEIWSLFINHNKTTSMHCHPNKKTALIVLDGSALFSSLNESMELFPMDAVVIEPGVFHSTQAISKSGLRLLEFETPPMKHDLVRLEDKYGRANEGYEGMEKMIDNAGTAIRFGQNDHNISKKYCNNNLCIKIIKNGNDLSNLKKNGIFTLMPVLSGSILSKNGDVLYSTGDIITHEEINGEATNYLFNDVCILCIDHTHLHSDAKLT